jgi:hypothetical protein
VIVFVQNSSLDNTELNDACSKVLESVMASKRSYGLGYLDDVHVLEKLQPFLVQHRNEVLVCKFYFNDDYDVEMSKEFEEGPDYPTILYKQLKICRG